MLLFLQSIYNPFFATFSYDAADRLTGWSIVNSTSYTADYSGNGNITMKSDFGLYAYNNSRPRAVSGISSLIAGICCQ